MLDLENIDKDSDSTHCLIHHIVAGSLHLAIIPTPTTHVTVANGKQLQCTGICKQVLLRLRHAEFLVIVFVEPPGSFSAVLGVNWLCTLGPLTWDFNDMVTTFIHEGNSVMLQGITEYGSLHYSIALQHELESPTMENLLEEFVPFLQNPRTCLQYTSTATRFVCYRAPSQW